MFLSYCSFLICSLIGKKKLVKIGYPFKLETGLTQHRKAYVQKNGQTTSLMYSRIFFPLIEYQFSYIHLKNAIALSGSTFKEISTD